MNIIINGRSLSGKDTIADYLVHKYNYKQVSFASPIYDIARKYFGMNEKDRDLLQKIGQKFREIDSNIWINYLLNSMDNKNKYVISDCRQANEYELCVNKGFFPIRVFADFDIRVERAIQRDGFYPDTELWENDSETGADDYIYYEIKNNGTSKELYDKIDILINLLNSKEIN